MGIAFPYGFLLLISALTKVRLGVGRMDISTWVNFLIGEWFGVLFMWTKGGNGTYLCFFML